MGMPVPKVVTNALPAWKPIFDRYGNELYCLAEVPKNNPELAKRVVGRF
jgi:hypothetical protein